MVSGTRSSPPIGPGRAAPGVELVIVGACVPRVTSDLHPLVRRPLHHPRREQQDSTVFSAIEIASYGLLSPDNCL